MVNGAEPIIHGKDSAREAPTVSHGTNGSGTTTKMELFIVRVTCRKVPSPVLCKTIGALTMSGKNLGQMTS